MKSDPILNILFVEDLPTDVELAQRELRKEKIEFSPRVVDTEKAFRAALDKLEPDIVISDYSMPSFDGMSALKIAREQSQNLPFIMLTGSINEETAVACMKAGANDYVLKEQIKRLPFAVREAIQRDQARLEKEEMENSLRESEARFKNIMASMQDIVFTLDREQRHTGVYGPWIEQQGLTPDHFLGKTARDMMSKEEALIHEKANEQALKGDFVIYEWSLSAGDSTQYFQTSLSPIIDDRGAVEGLVGIGRNISDLKQAGERLKLLSHSVEQSPASTVITDINGTIEYVNAAFCKHTGYTQEEVIGKTPHILNSAYHPDSFFKDMWDTILAGKDWRNEVRNKKKNGDYFWEDVIVSSILNDRNEINHFISIREDITEAKKMTDALVAEKEKAEMSDKLKSVFLANMSHEIRTPMNGIMGFIDLLQKQDLTPDVRTNYLAIIRKSSTRLLNTLNDIIEISKIEAGQVDLNPKEFHLTEVLQHFYDFHKLEGKNKGLAFQLRTAFTEENDLIVTDRHKLESILDNFIKNAVKFTSQGSIEIGAKAEKETLVLYVRDSGIGIPADRLESIFERFVQADLTVTKGYEGSGLGLAICKAYSEMLGGTLRVESQPGEGSVFSLLLPLEIMKQPDAAAGSRTPKERPSDRPFDGLDILIAEDDVSSVFYLKALLEDQCKTIRVAVNGTEAVAQVQNAPEIDLVLMDVKMPEMDGFTATRKIREFNRDVLIIAQTAYAMEGDSQKALDAGCDGYIAKPVREEELFRVAGDLLKEKNR